LPTCKPCWGHRGGPSSRCKRTSNRGREVRPDQGSRDSSRSSPRARCPTSLAPGDCRGVMGVVSARRWRRAWHFGGSPRLPVCAIHSDAGPLPPAGEVDAAHPPGQSPSAGPVILPRGVTVVRPTARTPEALHRCPRVAEPRRETELRHRGGHVHVGGYRAWNPGWRNHGHPARRLVLRPQPFHHSYICSILLVLLRCIARQGRRSSRYRWEAPGQANRRNRPATAARSVSSV
jgi:hypothetical protein